MDAMHQALDSSDDPLQLFAEWMALAKATPAITEPTAMCLATVDAANQPSARIVLLKEASKRGFVFHTNYESRKSREIDATHHAALCFYWMPLDRQIRITGPVEKLDAAASDAYFAGRARERQIGATTSRQSQPLPSRQQFMAELAETEARFEGRAIPRPAHWGGWRVVPEEIEFWVQLPHRYHERRVFRRQDAGSNWESTRLYP